VIFSRRALDEKFLDTY